MKAFPVIALAAGALMLSACTGGSLMGKFRDLQNQGEEHAARGLAEIAVYRCQTMTVEQRAHFVDAFNAEMMAWNEPIRAEAIDCDGDGESDF